MPQTKVSCAIVLAIVFATSNGLTEFPPRVSAQTRASSAVKQARTPAVSKLKVPLSNGWQFREAGKDQWHAATVPGCVHTDLLNNKLIDDPFYRDNEKKLQWIGKTDWEYQTSFNLAPEMLAKTKLELVFEGLDTYTNILLNGEPLLTTDNMFRTWRIDVKPPGGVGRNTLLVRFA